MRAPLCRLDAASSSPEEHCPSIGARWQRICAAHHVGYAILTIPEDNPVVEALSADPAWVMEYDDREVAILRWVVSLPAAICDTAQSGVQAHVELT